MILEEVGCNKWTVGHDFGGNRLFMVYISAGISCLERGRIVQGVVLGSAYARRTMRLLSMHQESDIEPREVSLDIIRSESDLLRSPLARERVKCKSDAAEAGPSPTEIRTLFDEYQGNRVHCMRV